MADRKFPQMGLFKFGLHQEEEPTLRVQTPPPDDPGWRSATGQSERLNGGASEVREAPPAPQEPEDHADDELGTEDEPLSEEEDEPEEAAAAGGDDETEIEEEPAPPQFACLHKERGCPANFYDPTDLEQHAKDCFYQEGKVMNCPDKACRGVNIPIMKFQTHFKNRHEIFSRSDGEDSKNYFWLMQKREFAQEDGKWVVGDLKVGTFWLYLTAELRPRTWPDTLVLFCHMPNWDKELTKGLKITYTLREYPKGRHIRTMTVGTCPPGATFDNTVGKNMALIRAADLLLCEKEIMEERWPGQEPILRTYYKVHFQAQYEDDE